MKVYTIRIRDQILHGDILGPLSFDLEDILRSINGHGYKYIYAIEYLEEVVIRPERIDLDANVFYGTDYTRRNITFDELLKFSSAFAQISDCKVIGQYENTTLSIEAFDATFWEIITIDYEIVIALQKRFSKVEIE